MSIKLGAVHMARPRLRPTTQPTYKTMWCHPFTAEGWLDPCPHWMMLSGCPFWATCPGSEAVVGLGMLLCR